MDKTIKICTYNTNGLRDILKRRAIFDWLKNKNYAIAFLQETHSCVNSSKKWESDWGGKIIFSHGETNSKGVAIIFSNNLDVEIVDTLNDQAGRLVRVDCIINGKSITLINIYCPTKVNENEQLCFLDNVIDYINYNGENEFIIGGDLNTYLDISIDKRGSRSELQSRYSKKWNSVIENFDLVDIWRLRNPNELRFTWRAKSRNGLVQSRIDYILLSRSLEYMVKNTSITPSIRSDHSVVDISLIFLDIQTRGKGLWKMNCKYLKDELFLEFIRDTIREAKIQSVRIENKMLKWDFIKCMIRSKILEYSISKKREERQTEENLLLRLNVLEEEFDKNPNSNKYEEYTLLKHELDFIHNVKAKGSIIRSRCRWAEDNEKNTKYFLNLEKHNYNTKYIKSLLVENKIIDLPEEILKCESKFYQNLYAKNDISSTDEINQYLSNIITPKLCNNTKQLCEAQITIDEYTKALKGLSNNKTPGSDGIPVEFYKIFWDEIKTEVIESFESGKINKELSFSQREGIISLIPKQGKDLRELKNWRPLSLLNCDYKILTKVLANRMKIGLKEIINEDQIGYMEKRFCGENTRLIADILEYATAQKIESILLLIDFEKAFDTISWNFLYKTLEFYNFGENFISWIKLLYTNIFSKVTNNGYFSNNFSIYRGIRQGDPISALLFLPVAEVMATVIRNNRRIRGIKIGSKEFKLCQLADDTSIFLKDVESIRIALSTFEEFYRYAGLKLNRSKTEATILYNNGNIQIDQTLNIKWNDKHFKTLGIWYSLNTSEMLNLNIDERMEKIKVLLRIWNTRCLSLKGKIVVLKSLVMPHIIHIASVLYIDDTIISEFDKLLFDFLWSNRKHGINKATCIKNIDMGGIKMICINTMIKSIKIMWVKRLLNPINANWKSLSWHILGINKEMLFCRLNKNYINMPKVKFYSQVLDVWYDFLDIEPLTNEDILNENIFYNKFITVGNKTLGKEFVSCKKAGICKIKDLCTVNENSFLNYADLKTKFNVNIDILTYNKLIMSIPKSWKTSLKQLDNKGISKLHLCLYKNNDMTKLYNRDVYNILIERNSSPVISQEKWIESYPFLECVNWSHLYRLPYAICRDTYIQSLQFKILHRYINCNANLCRMKIIETPNCNDCEGYDSIEHFFYECPKMILFWTNIQAWLFNILDVNIDFTLLEILLGILQENNYSTLCNYIILHGKKYIYNNKNQQKAISTIEFIKKVKYSLYTEYEVSVVNNNVEQFMNIFGDLYNSL